MITNGTYEARAVGEAKLSESPEKGTPFLECYYEVQSGPHKGQRVRWTGYFAERSKARTIESMQISGWDGDDLSEFLDGGLHGLDRHVVAIVVEIESYLSNGEERTSPRVKWVNRVGSRTEAISPTKASELATRMRGLVLELKSKQTEFPVPAAPKGRAF